MEASGSSRPTGSIAKREEKKDAPIGKYQVAIFSPSILSYFLHPDIFSMQPAATGICFDACVQCMVNSSKTNHEIID